MEVVKSSLLSFLRWKYFAEGIYLRSRRPGAAWTRNIYLRRDAGQSIAPDLFVSCQHEPNPSFQSNGLSDAGIHLATVFTNKVQMSNSKRYVNYYSASMSLVHNERGILVDIKCPRNYAMHDFLAMSSWKSTPPHFTLRVTFLISKYGNGPA